MKDKSSGCLRKFLLTAILGGSVLCIVLTGLSYLSNLILPSHSSDTALLSDLDKARLAEANHLRKTLGDSVWPGWGSANIPTILYNEEYAFLVGLPDPAPGWTKVYPNKSRGGAWEAVQGDSFQSEVYYRQRLTDHQMTPEAFTVLVGNQWVASLTTKEWTEIGLAEPIRESLPSLLQSILPYKLYSRLLVGNSDRYITLVLHEAFHAYEGLVAGARLEAAENAMHAQEKKYPWDDAELEAAWQVELDYLSEAIRSTAKEPTLEQAHLFLAQRQARRTEQNLSPAMIAYENLREWEEGLSKYVELEIWRQASTTPGYQPDPAIVIDNGFKDYMTFEKQWRQEISNIDNDAEDVRFYYTGMAQAFLLDRLMPAWKEKFIDEDMTLEDLLREAIQ